MHSGERTVSTDEPRAFPVQEGALYEVRYRLVAALPRGRIAGVQIDCEFRAGDVPLSTRMAFRVEAFDSRLAKKIDPAFLLGSRFFYAPPRSTSAELRLRFPEGAAPHDLEIKLHPFEAPDLARLARSLREMNEKRLAALRRRLWRRADRAAAKELLHAAEAEVKELAAQRRFTGTWPEALLTADVLAEVAAFRQRCRYDKGPRPAIGFIGSERLFFNLAGAFQPVHIGRKDDVDDFLALRPTALVVEFGRENLLGEWSADLLLPGGEIGRDARAVFDRCRARGVPIVSVCPGELGDWASFDAVLEVSTRVLCDPEIVEPLRARQPTQADKIEPYEPHVDLRLCAPILDDASTEVRLLFPCAADLYQSAKLKNFIQNIAGSHLLLTDFHFWISPHSIREYLKLDNVEIMARAAYPLSLRLMRNAGVVILSAQTTLPPAIQSEIVLDATASGAVVVYVGNAADLGALGALVQEAPEYERAVEILGNLRDWNYREQVWLAAYRKLRGQLSSSAGIPRLLLKVSGVQPTTDKPPLASVILVSKRPEFVRRAIRNFENQAHQSKELIFIGHGFDLEPLMAAYFHERDYKFYRVSKFRNIGYCLNLAIAKSRGQYWFKFDDDDYYGPNYLDDLVAAFEWSGADAAGKPPAFVYFEESDTVAMRNVAKGRRRQWLGGSLALTGATLAGRYDANLPTFSAHARAHCDSDWVRRITTSNNVLVADHLNFVVFRSNDISFHTWQAAEGFFERRSGVISRAGTHDFLGKIDDARGNYAEWS